jgi:hypothetical protein
MRATLKQPVLFPQTYGWYITAAAADTLLTAIILTLGGIEVNAVAAGVINHYGLLGMLLFKFATVYTVLLICEYIGRHRIATAQRLGTWAVIISLVPVAVGVHELVRYGPEHGLFDVAGHLGSALLNPFR